MSTTSDTGVPVWTAADVLYASAGEDGPHATVWTVTSHDVDGGPPGAPEVRDVARTHSESLGSSPGWTGGELTEAQDGAMRVLTRPLSHQDGTVALAAYWAMAGSVGSAWPTST